SAPGVATVGVAFSPDGTHFLVSGGPGSNSIQKYAYPSNTHTGSIGGVIGSGERISFLDATTAFVVNGCGQCGNLQKVSTASNSVVNTLSLGDFGQGLAIAPSGASLVAGRGGVSPQVQRIDPASVTVTGSLNMASFANGLAYTPDGGRLYASEQNLDRVVVIDPSALAVIGDPIPVGSGPVDIQMVKVPYAFSGFFQPVDNLPVLNRVTAGRSVPVKFSLGGDQGLDVLAAGFPKSEQISCDSTAPVDGIEETVTAGGSSLSYDATTDQYTYVWKTNRSWASSCRQFVMKLNDGTVHRANFMFK
ncbi:MAG TPA: PxKF domain-containing protein, partial [Micromonosporaceae bacterium]|nr:PxKF domain-containing protein [Micromonosporaceae bacterium]